jgi:phosphatidylserine/phosphatidylglycerophosphate/cardiolipin synthase-like enzyme
MSPKILHHICIFQVLTTFVVFGKVLEESSHDLPTKGNLMKLITTLLITLTLILCTVLSPSFALPQENPCTSNWEVYFSPHGGATEAIVRELNKAKASILVQAYSFTSAPIAKAILNAHKRGVKIEVILDKSQRTQKYSSATFLYNQGIPVKIDGQHTIAHNKVMIIDGETVITGSFNFTKAAEENNAENLLVIRDTNPNPELSV